MARYRYVCVNGHEREVVKAMVDYDTPEECLACQRVMVHVLDLKGVQFMNRGGLAGTRGQA